MTCTFTNSLTPRFSKYLLAIALVCATWLPASAQLTVSNNLNVTQLLQTLFGGGITISNLTTSCDTTLSMGSFNGNNSNLGLSTGVILSTGNIASAPGPNTQTGVTGVMNTPGNALLTGISGQSTFDACVIEFDISPLCDTIAISYVFASDEYPEFVGSINDVFGFFISGPGYVGNQNIAVIPGTATPVSINTINPGSNPGLYVNNTGGQSIEYDGMTVPLVATAAVVPCETYHLTIAVADASDNILDSSVFLEAGGIGCSTPVLQLTATNDASLGANVAVEECVNGLLNFSVPIPLLDTTTFRFTIGGTATSGLDYVAFADSVVIDSGQTTASLPVTILSDNLAEGAEYIEIVYTDSNLCATQIYRDTAYLQILDPPDFYQSSDVVFCSGDSVPIGSPTLSGQQYSWSSTTGLSATSIADPIISITNPTDTTQVFEYVLTTIALQGYCEFQDTISVTVHPVNLADFLADTVCETFSTTFLDQTFADTVVSYFWDFGDGGTDVVRNPVHTYATPGIYSVELITVNGSACPDTLVKDVEVLPIPVMNVQADTVCLGTATTFTNLTTPATDLIWDFGDGTVSTAFSPIHIYPATGAYTVRVLAATGDGCRDSLSFDVWVNENPIADFTAEGVCLTENMSFVNLSTPGTGTQLNYQWNFGDFSFPSIQENPSHTYGSFGLFDVSLSLSDENGCTAVQTKPVSVYPSVAADFTYVPVCFGNITPFTDLSVDNPLGPIQSWDWEFGDGNVSTDVDPIHLYNSYGAYNARLVVTSLFNCKDTVEKVVEVWDEPIGDFDLTARCDNEPISFANTSQFNNTNVTWAWDFGDGNTSTQESPDHLYTGHGQYPVSLVIQNNNGCRDTISKSAEVYPLPVAAFETSPICYSLTSVFVDESTIPDPGRIGQYRWEFGNGGLAGTVGQATVIYQQPGIYTAELWVQSTNGCLDSISKEVTIWPNPSISFSTQNVCAGDTALFGDLTTIVDSVTADRIVGWNWDFGDGASLDGLASPGHAYRDAGVYEITLSAVSDKGCESQASRLATMYPIPEAPTIQDEIVCFGDPAFLLALPDFPGVRVEWFSDLTSPSPFHTEAGYATPPVLYEQTYYVEAISGYACRGIRVPITAGLFGERVGEIVASDEVVEIPNAIVNFYVAGTYNAQEIVWSFGDGTTAIGLEVSHQYLLPGKYEVTARIGDETNCEAILSQVIEVKQNIGIHVPSAFSPNHDGVNDVFYIGHRLIQQFDIQVYNRWGQLVYEASDPGFQWDGRSTTGKTVREGVYVYRIQAVDIQGNRQDQSGTITILN